MRVHMIDDVSSHISRDEEHRKNIGLSLFFAIAGLFIVYFGFSIGRVGLIFIIVGGFFILAAVISFLSNRYWHKKYKRRYYYGG